MKIKAVCNQCGKDYWVDKEYTGKKAKCKECSNVFRIPTLETMHVEDEPLPPEQQLMNEGNVILIKIVAAGILLVAILLTIILSVLTIQRKRAEIAEKEAAIIIQKEKDLKDRVLLIDKFFTKILHKSTNERVISMSPLAYEATRKGNPINFLYHRLKSSVYSFGTIFHTKYAISELGAGQVISEFGKPDSSKIEIEYVKDYNLEKIEVVWRHYQYLSLAYGKRSGRYIGMTINEEMFVELHNNMDISGESEISVQAKVFRSNLDYCINRLLRDNIYLFLEYKEAENEHSITNLFTWDDINVIQKSSNPVQSLVSKLKSMKYRPYRIFFFIKQYRYKYDDLWKKLGKYDRQLKRGPNIPSELITPESSLTDRMSVSWYAYRYVYIGKLNIRNVRIVLDPNHLGSRVVLSEKKIDPMAEDLRDSIIGVGIDCSYFLEAHSPSWLGVKD